MTQAELLEQEISEVGIHVVDRAVEGYKGLLVRKNGLTYVFVRLDVIIGGLRLLYDIRELIGETRYSSLKPSVLFCF